MEIARSNATIAENDQRQSWGSADAGAKKGVVPQYPSSVVLAHLMAGLVACPAQLQKVQTSRRHGNIVEANLVPLYLELQIPGLRSHLV